MNILKKLEEEQSALQKRADNYTKTKNLADSLSDNEKIRLEALNKTNELMSTALFKENIEEQKEFIEINNNKIKKIAADFQVERAGLSWDVAGGFATEFKNRTFNKSRIYNAGLWTTIGYTHKKNGTFLGLVRVFHNPEQIFAKNNLPNLYQNNITTFDAGFRYVYGSSQSKFNASIETIYRSVLTKNTVDPNWRLVFNADYSIFKNQKLTFSFGKNFDGTITKDGNLIASISFLTGF